MKISVPSESVYYYECTGVKNRLLFWIPINELNKLVKKKKVKKEIVRDFPDGLDIKVSQDAFDEYRETYGLEMDVNPTFIWYAFLSIRLKEKDSFRGTGYLSAEFLEEQAIRIEKRIKKDVKPSAPLPVRPVGVQQRKRVISSRIRKESRLNLFLRKFPVPKIKKSKPLPAQKFSKVKMTKGEDAGKVFSSLRNNKRR